MPRSLCGVGFAPLLCVAAAARAQCPLAFVLAAPPPDAPVIALATLDNGDLVVGGSFTTFGGVAASRVAIGNGSTWAPLGGGVDGVVSAIAEMPNGDVVIAGAFTQAGGVPANGIARWNGATWAPLGGGIGGVVAMAALPNGDLVVGGFFHGGALQHIARWDGSTWSGVGVGTALPVNSVAVRPQGDVVFTSWDGVFGTVTRLQQWSGTSVVDLAIQPQAAFRCVHALPNGDLWVGGSFSSIGNVAASGLARWNGTTWIAAALGSGSNVQAMDVLPDGDLVVAGSLGLASGLVRIARIHNGIATPLESPVTAVQTLGAPVHAVATLGHGELVFGGNFPSLGTSAAPHFATLRTPCPATATPFGSGCAGSNGVDTLAATSLPWTGGTFASRATGMPSLGVVAMVYGFSSFAIPLASVLTPVAPGCTGYVSPDFMDLQLPSAGVVAAQLPIPADPALVGGIFHANALAFEFDAVGNLVVITSSNALTMTIGTF